MVYALKKMKSGVLCLKLKKRLIFFLVCIIFALTACGNDEEKVKENNEETSAKEQSEEVRVLIDETNPLDERAIIEEVMEKQKQKLKLGFITDDYQLMSTELDYYGSSDELSYLQSFKLNEAIPWLTYKTTMDSNET